MYQRLIHIVKEQLIQCKLCPWWNSPCYRGWKLSAFVLSLPDNHVWSVIGSLGFPCQLSTWLTFPVLARILIQDAAEDSYTVLLKSNASR
ncbi:hypothetical protein NSUAAKTH_0003 [Klebsiella phage Oda]|uniref:Uncharacterized protein n=1 Tax=Klebsiella phage Oda TaxID=3018522 RepID=A0AAF0D6V1_9CAUD|nr:hypothetical protein NSUAAKTH_0003 [Klebsiella phage Oda]